MHYDCSFCNLSKSQRFSGTDSTGKEQSLYNPRAYDPSLLGWYLHFALERATGRIVAHTPIGEATIQALNMNSRHRAYARKLQIDAGLIA
jgi:hypothetical protein